MLLEIKNLTHHYQKRQVLTDISFTLDHGEILGVIGPNGGGKSTLLKILANTIRPTSGTISLNHKVTYLPQIKELNTTLPVTTKEFISFEDGENSVTEIIDLVGLNGKEDYLLSHLSGGERQRALLGKSLRRDPTLLLLDEPTTGLDMSGQDQLYKVIRNIVKKNGCGVIIVDHNIHELLAICNKILCLNNSSHWHTKKDEVTKEALQNIYHCEFEHLLLHTEKESATQTHTMCPDDHRHSHKPPFIKKV